ncbi:hypothetical protein SEA_CLOWN_60 [Gordonia phage Clown]|uniref:Uncharacterized protein n=1 Tax=Gordonia phage Clown TaxID=2759393 RepID=A0A7L7SLK6_9CAUD|nr:hypothetical protein KNV25_gp60 [Gordonia phage Clown]QOC56058.1 hypothetical protein SEA_CLOWN_60 [Gordonia phage Clown]
MTESVDALLARVRERAATEPAPPPPTATQARRLAALLHPAHEETGR